jgi:hypothetical protein
LTATALRDDQDVTYAIATTERDLRERKLVLEAQQASKKADLVKIAHTLGISQG